MRDCGDVESMHFINGKYVISIIMQQRKEISILLPVYNRVCVGMVARLKELCDDVEGLRYEIIAADDGSDDRDAVAKNKAICRMEGCRYVVRDTNSGAAATRNFLTGISRYRWLLFVDCDMSVPDDWFIHRYLEAPEAGVVSGGMRTGGKAADARRSLRCAYERRAQERHTAAERRRHPYQAFRSVNFMAERSVMESCPFDERMRRYEDVMFGRRLEENGVTVCHIDNPVVMDDFESNTRFVEKTEKDMLTLREFYSDMKGYSRMIDITEALSRRHMLWAVKSWHNVFGQAERRLLTGKKAHLRIYDAYKLGFFATCGAGGASVCAPCHGSAGGSVSDNK